MSAFDTLPTSASRQMMRRMVHVIDLPTDLARSKDDFWIFYGSVVINSLQPESDVDALYVTTQPIASAFRHQAYYDGRPVTVYVVSKDLLEKDGVDYEYGGYFSGKLLSPHVVVDASGGQTQFYDTYVQSVVGGFLANFIDTANAKEIAADNVPMLVLDAYLRLCPWYDAYLVKFFSRQSIVNAERLAVCLARHYIDSLVKAGVLVQAGNVYEMTLPSSRDTHSESVYRRRLRAVARFWSYGAIEHGGRHHFSDFYFDKADATLEKIDCDGTLRRELYQRFTLDVAHSAYGWSIK